MTGDITFTLKADDKWMAKMWLDIPPAERRIILDLEDELWPAFRVGHRVEMILSCEGKRWELSGIVESCEAKRLVLRAASTEPPVKVWQL